MNLARYNSNQTPIKDLCVYGMYMQECPYCVEISN